MRITALVESRDHVCCRYRLASYQPFLEAAGHQLDFRPRPKSFWSRLHLGRLVEDADAVILQRRLLPQWQLYLLRSNARRLFFDFDDAVFHNDSYSAKGTESPGKMSAFVAMCATADLLMPGNRFLRKQTARWAEPERIHLLPTCLDPARYPLADHARAGRDVQLVWIGSSVTLKGLEQVQPLLDSVGAHCPGTVLKVICNRFPRFKALPVVPCPWSSGSEAAELAAADIGISWIPDDPWSMGKCGLKLLQYMAAGLPVVANPVGVQQEIVRHGETGFLVETAAEWIEAIDWLVRDPELRRRLGQAGRKRVEEEFSLQRGAARLLQVLSAHRVRSAVT